ncbi:MAG: hypothetical protein Q8K26_01260 [Candidatus Gracilibacteria bacterium]|nr:hypothetical protein [Candidatus Gracilibacteria bacterium]
MTTIQRQAPISIYAYSMKYLNKEVSKKAMRKQSLVERIDRVSGKGQEIKNISEIDRIAYFQ